MCVVVAVAVAAWLVMLTANGTMLQYLPQINLNRKNRKKETVFGRFLFGDMKVAMKGH